MKNLKRIAALVLVICLLPIVNVFAATVDMQVTFTNDLNRHAGGNITITSDTDDKVWFWWGDDNTKIADHTYFGFCNITSGTGEFEIQRYTYIPEGATQILAYSDADGQLVASYDLPENKIMPMGDKSYSFGAVSDTHLGEESNNSHINSAEDFARVYPKLGELGVSLIINGGDLTSHALNEAWQIYTDGINEFHKTYSDVPCFAVTGNHDAQYKALDQESWKKYTLEDLVNYKGYGKPEYYDGNTLDFVYKMENDVFLFFNMTNWVNPNNSLEYHTNDQIDWLERRLEENKDKRVFLLMHIPTFYANNRYYADGTAYTPASGKPDNSFNEGDYMDRRFTAIFEKYPNVMVFTGHSHQGFEYQLAQYVQGTEWGDTMDQNVNDANGGAKLIHIPSMTTPGQYVYDEATDTAKHVGDTSKSEGYVVDVYDDCVVLRGYNFMTDEYMSFGNYIIDIGCDFNDVDVKDELLLDNTNKNITVKGTAGEENAAAQVAMMLTYKNADVNNLTKEDILYYDQQTTDGKGSYSFSFKIPASVTDEEFKVYVNINGKNMSDTITETAIGTDWLDVGVETIQLGADGIKAVYTMKNYSEEEIDCRIIFAVHDENGVLIEVKTAEKSMPTGTESERLEIDLPDNAKSVSAYIQAADGSMKPLCKNKVTEISAK